MKNIKSKSEILLRSKNSVYESVSKMGDDYRISGVIVPKNIISQFVSKAKKDYNIDAKENFSDVDLAEMFVDYVVKNYLNVDSLPVKTLLGIAEDDTNEIKDEIVNNGSDEDTEDFTTPETTEDEIDSDDEEIHSDVEDITAEENDEDNLEEL